MHAPGTEYHLPVAGTHRLSVRFMLQRCPELAPGQVVWQELPGLAVCVHGFAISRAQRGLQQTTSGRTLGAVYPVLLLLCRCTKNLIAYAPKQAEAARVACASGFPPATVQQGFTGLCLQRVLKLVCSHPLQALLRGGKLPVSGQRSQGSNSLKPALAVRGRLTCTHARQPL